ENPTGARNGGTKGKDCEKLHPCFDLPAGETFTLVDTDGPGMINHIWIGGLLGHECIIRMYWDNREYPSVEVPASAFFGYPYDEAYVRVDRDHKIITLNSSKVMLAPTRSYNCYWEMPFWKHCKITIENRGEQKVNMFYEVAGYYGEIPEDSGYFHAVYRQEHPVQKGRAYTVLDNVEGKGYFAGLFFAVGVNGTSWCWCEGEPKMYIDGETYPSINYTGTEDYFCGSYAFGNDSIPEWYQTYSGLYAGLYAILGDTREKYNVQQRFLLYRWHDKDPVYFDKSFRMTIDDGIYAPPIHSPRYDDFTSVAFYYLTEPKALPFELPSHFELFLR
ncbi:MAG: DUF2961 domain-containing protein, partial [Clostridia bacterium]|nr:DUF2961 domain-containing protein [Clostridia bacterium]